MNEERNRIERACCSGGKKGEKINKQKRGVSDLRLKPLSE